MSTIDNYGWTIWKVDYHDTLFEEINSLLTVENVYRQFCIIFSIMFSRFYKVDFVYKRWNWPFNSSEGKIYFQQINFELYEGTTQNALSPLPRFPKEPGWTIIVSKDQLK